VDGELAQERSIEDVRVGTTQRVATAVANAGAVICFGGWIFAGIRMMSGRCVCDPEKSIVPCA
jgi:hypothetical protein